MGEKPPGRPRRTVLRAALATLGVVAVAPLSGCVGEEAPPWEPEDDPLMPLYRTTEALIARYDATMSALPALAERLKPLREHHGAHLEALAREIGLPDPGPSGSGSPAGSPERPGSEKAAFDALLSAEKDGARAALDACLAAPGWRAPLLGSIAACRASHAEVLT